MPHFNFKTKKLSRFLLFIAIPLLCCCTSIHRSNGWYPVSDLNKIEGNIIASVADFETVVLDTTSIPGITFIDGKLTPDATKRFTEASEQRIGKRIGFVYKDSVITAPTVHCRIESGTFTINSDDKNLLITIYNSITSEPH